MKTEQLGMAYRARMKADIDFNMAEAIVGGYDVADLMRLKELESQGRSVHCVYCDQYCDEICPRCLAIPHAKPVCEKCKKEKYLFCPWCLNG
jgi:hypothetical protein